MLDIMWIYRQVGRGNDPFPMLLYCCTIFFPLSENRE